MHEAFGLVHSVDSLIFGDQIFQNRTKIYILKFKKKLADPVA